MIYWNEVILIDTQRHHTGCFTWSHIEPRHVIYCGTGSALGGVPVCIGGRTAASEPPSRH